MIQVVAHPEDPHHTGDGSIHHRFDRASFAQYDDHKRYQQPQQP